MEAPGVVDRANVSETQAAAQNRMHSDSVWYARLGYGAQFADQVYGGPSVSFFEYRREGNRYGIDVSFLNFQYKACDQTYILWTRRQFRNYWHVVEARDPALLLVPSGS